MVRTQDSAAQARRLSRYLWNESWVSVSRFKKMWLRCAPDHVMKPPYEHIDCTNITLQIGLGVGGTVIRGTAACRNIFFSFALCHVQ